MRSQERNNAAFLDSPQSVKAQAGTIEVFECYVKNEMQKVFWFKEERKIEKSSFRYDFLYFQIPELRGITFSYEFF